MWIFNYTLLEIALRTIVVYTVVLIGIRLTGKREVGQMTPFDLVLLMLMANAVQNAMTGPDTSVTGGLVAVLSLLAMNEVVTRIVLGHRKLRRFVEGTPTLLIHKGILFKEHMRKEKISIEALHQALREDGVANVADVCLAVLEIDGSISVLKNDEMPVSQRPHHRIRFFQRKSN